MTHEEWIERYRRAWETADANEIADLFTADATYRSSVFREPYLGRDAIREYWQRAAGSQRQTAVMMGQPVVTAARVVVEWWTTMIDPDDGEITLPGCLLLRFAADGRCHDLWEYWQIQPGRHNPPAGWGGQHRRPPRQPSRRTDRLPSPGEAEGHEMLSLQRVTRLSCLRPWPGTALFSLYERHVVTCAWRAPR